MVGSTCALAVTAFCVGFLMLVSPRVASAHCDTMDGPVVKAAQKALESGNVNFVLLWVPEKDEGEIRTAFAKTLAVRKLGADARELADRFFFETVVRIHRAGEGEPFTGLKPAGQDPGAAIAAADKAVETKKVEPVVELLINAVREGVHHRFEQMIHRRNFDADDVNAGRAYIEAYVNLVHFVAGVFDVAIGEASESSHGEHP